MACAFRPCDGAAMDCSFLMPSLFMKRVRAGSRRRVAGRRLAGVAIGAALSLAFPASAQAQDAGALKSFKDWVVGCDNLRACVALGLGPEAGVGDAYVRVRRGADAGARPELTITLAADGGGVAPALSLSLDGAPAVPPKATARRDGDFLSATLGAAQAAPFLAALREGKTLAVALKGAEKAKISLTGAAAALLYMDAAQNRAGTASALVDRGDAPFPAITAPIEPVVAAARMRLVRPPPSPPKALASSGDDSCRGYEPIAVALSATETLWGLCDLAAAYNFAYRFWIVGPDGARPAAFPGADQDGPVLTNPGLVRDGLALAMFEKGRGAGDCGRSAQWAYDGAGFRLVLLSQMDECRGVAPGDWPVLYRAALRPL
ncbi:DUF1176 domain-containing protein [Methylocella sp.]|uniref:DUF1176 domain-containing protein n=1 Tax=Methylocella sp. TaxID=1978226 RepID=UPI0037848DC1